MILAAAALQIAARSVGEMPGIGYVFAAYCPIVVPSNHHTPPPYGMLGDVATAVPADYPGLWAQDAVRFTEAFARALNGNRRAAGLAPVDDVRSHIFTDRPWLAVEPTLAPWPEAGDRWVFQTGAGVLPGERPLPRSMWSCSLRQANRRSTSVSAVSARRIAW